MEKKEFKKQREELKKMYGENAVLGFLETFGDKYFYYDDLESCFQKSFSGGFDSFLEICFLRHFGEDEVNFFREIVYDKLSNEDNDEDNISIKSIFIDKISEDYEIFKKDNIYYLFYKHF